MTRFRPLSLDASRPARSMIRLLSPHRWRASGALALFIAKDAPVWLIPFFTSRVVDVVVQGGPPDALLWWGGAASAALLLNYPLTMGFVWISSRIFRGVAASLRNAITDHAQRLSIGYHRRTSPAVMQSKVVRDVEKIELALGQVLPGVASSLGVFVGALVMTAILVPTFVVVFALAVPLGVLLMTTMRSRATVRNEEFRKEVETLARRVGEMANLIPITRAHGLEAAAKERVALSAERVRTSGVLLDQLNGRFAVSSWISYQLLGTACLIVAAWTSISGAIDISPGEVVMLSAYFATLTGSVVQLMNLFPTFSSGLESVKSVAELTNDPDIEQNYNKPAMESVAGDLRFESVRLRYENEVDDTLRGVTISVAAGETLALVGSSGSGKSTVLNLALGFLRPTSGSILVDGRDLNTFDLRTYRRFVSVVPQEPVLFEGSIRENVTYGLEGVGSAEVEAALADANALEFVSELALGWDTPVGDAGARLSGGQRQRIAIARALIRDPRILLLDEATSALDSASEGLVQQALERLKIGRTTLVVAHRLSTVKSADRIVVLERGAVAETGTHGRLLGERGRYAQLFGNQAG